MNRKYINKDKNKGNIKKKFSHVQFIFSIYLKKYKYFKLLRYFYFNLDKEWEN